MLNSAQAKFSILMRIRIILDPPILAVIYIRDFNRDFPDFTRDFKISTDISGFQRRFHGFHERFQDFNGDFRISRKISDFTRDFRRSVRDFGKWRTPRENVLSLPRSRIRYCARAHGQRPPQSRTRTRACK